MGGTLESHPPETRARGVDLEGQAVELERGGARLRSSDVITWDALTADDPGWHPGMAQAQEID